MDEDLKSGAVITPQDTTNNTSQVIDTTTGQVDNDGYASPPPPPADPAPQPVLTEDPFKADNPPPPSQKSPKAKRGGMPKALLVLIIIVLVAAAAAGVYFWQQGQVKSAKGQADDLSQQVSSLQKQVSDLKKAKTTPAPAPTNKNIIKVKELGIQFTAPDSLKDLTYTIKTNTFGNNQTGTTAYFTTASLLAKDKLCTGENGPLGAVSKVAGTYPTNPTPDNSDGPLTKQFSSFYISYSHSQSTCSADKTAQSLQTSQASALQEAIKTVEPLS